MFSFVTGSPSLGTLASVASRTSQSTTEITVVTQGAITSALTILGNGVLFARKALTGPSYSSSSPVAEGFNAAVVGSGGVVLAGLVDKVLSVVSYTLLKGARPLTLLGRGVNHAIMPLTSLIFAGVATTSVLPGLLTALHTHGTHIIKDFSESHVAQTAREALSDAADMTHGVVSKAGDYVVPPLKTTYNAVTTLANANPEYTIALGGISILSILALKSAISCPSLHSRIRNFQA
jgi:hypothetical protein